ncbi:peroxiredoxin-like family protein [Cohnella sp. AR92]|uniref:peroxiredoxin-like family protein n=1 Tax=Cohnella sp. AR92 TaxID=648716 RepID=UPI000F8DDD11|nr:peroxiredoxin-like family protein [Cohnella sp. AR92]RUS48988.1 AhpC/TSA family protein [Cohnella sp. AR92]
MRLEQALHEAKERFKSRVPEDAQEGIFRLIREQRGAGAIYGLKEGQRAVDFTLNNAEGSPVNLFEQLAHGPVVLTFYRGEWCPFCNLQLRAYQNILAEIEALGGRLIAVSPQTPDRALSQQEREELRFDVLSDSEGKAAESYRLLFEVPPYLRELMTTRMKLDLADYNEGSRWILPVPATFVIDPSGVIRLASVNPDFMERLEPRVLLDELTKIAGR